ncbi:MAG: FkbM family methyltransferase [Candidatus Scalindua sp.]
MSDKQRILMSVKRSIIKLLTQLLKKSIQIVGGGKATAIMAQVSEEIAPVVIEETDFGAISFFCPGIIPEIRAKTILTKEPETIEWINGFNEADVFWDIGANVGVYSLCAAMKGLSVLAFEPSPSNYYLLCKNIEINKMDDKISAYCVAVNNNTKLDTLYMPNTDLGGAFNSLGEAVNWQGKTFTVSLKQATVGFSIDDFIKQFKPLFPNHIKIDVDGIEDRIIKGGNNTFKDSHLKSLLVELDTENKELTGEVVDILNDSGLTLHAKNGPHMPDNSEFANVCNYIFVRS